MTLSKDGSRLAAEAAAVALLAAEGRALLVCLHHAVSALGFPYPLDYGEGTVLGQAVRLAHGENIYRSDLGSPPFVIANYPPVFLLLNVPFVRLLGPSFAYGRVLSLIAMLATVALIVATVRALTSDDLAAAAAGLLFPAFPYVVHWTPLDRIDTTALAASWLALFVIVRRGETRKGLLAGALLLTVAIYTRQSYALAAPLAAFCWVARRSGPRRALGLALSVAGMTVAAFLVANALTAGGFLLHTVQANMSPFRWEAAYSGAQKMGRAIPGLLAGGAVFLLLGGPLRLPGWWLAGPYLLGGALSALTVGHVGANVNYFLELAAGLSLAAGVALAGLRRYPLARAALMLLLAVQVVALVRWTNREFRAFIRQRIEGRQEIARLAKAIHETAGPVIADEYIGLLVLDGREPEIDPFAMTQMAMSGRWDPAPFLSSLEEKRYGLIVLFQANQETLYERWTPEMIEAMHAHYAPDDGPIASAILLRPRPGRTAGGG